MRPRPVLHKPETEIETDYYETETETKNVVSRPCWFWDLNIPAHSYHLSLQWMSAVVYKRGDNLTAHSTVKYSQQSTVTRRATVE